MSKIAKVEAQIIVKAGKQADLEFHDIDISIPDSIETLDKAQHFVVNSGLVTEKLRKIENFKSVRTQKVVKIEEVKGEKADDKPSKLEELLLVATEKGCVPESLERYKKEDSKVKALEQAIEGYDKRVKRQKKKKSNVTDQGYID